jgi:hypothetical protein
MRTREQKYLVSSCYPSLFDVSVVVVVGRCCSVLLGVKKEKGDLVVFNLPKI